jgi:signal transduction histidine kinase/ActR/RegA family two-component response regulator
MNLIHPDDAPAYTEGVMAAVSERRAFEAECRVRHADGSFRWIATSAAPRFSETGEFLGHVGSSPEITEHKRAEEALKEADRRKNEFLAILAHELRNPLAPIRSAVELLGVAPDRAATIDQVLPMLDRQVALLARLIEDLLDISRITAGKIQIRRQPTALEDIVRPVVEANRPAIEAAGLEVAVSLPDAPCMLDVDPVRFSQVLANLLHNAMKFTDAGGRIELTARLVEERAGKNLVLSVRDTGVGIPAAILPRVFDLFVQGEGDRRRREGLGIGLALARRLVEIQGGSIEAQSEEGRGSVFTLRLPVLDGSIPSAETSEWADVRPRTLPRVLIVDENQNAAETLAALVRSLGSETAVASSGEAGLSRASTFLPDVVLLDLGMQSMDGFETCRRLRAEEFGRDAFVVALTGRPEDPTRRRDPLRVGFNAQLTTPADVQRLEQVLSRAQPVPRKLAV